MKKNIGLWILACGVIFAACERLDMVGMFAGSSPTIDERWEESMAYNQEAGFDTLYAVAEDYHLYVCTDTHITKKRNRWEHFIASYRADKLCPVAVHLGDIIDAKTDVAYVEEALAPQMEGTNKHDTLMAVCGNHDIYFYQWDIYRSYYKTSVYWFDTNNGSKKLDLFICLDSADGELGNKQVNWLKDLLAEKADDGYRHIIVFTHTHLWKLDMSQGHTSNFALESTYELTSILGQYGVDYVWGGHQHARQLVEYNGVTYMAIDATKDQESNQAYMIANIGDKITYDYPDYPKVSE